MLYIVKSILISLSLFAKLGATSLPESTPADHVRGDATPPLTFPPICTGDSGISIQPFRDGMYFTFTPVKTPKDCAIWLDFIRSERQKAADLIREICSSIQEILGTLEISEKNKRAYDCSISLLSKPDGDLNQALYFMLKFYESYGRAKDSILEEKITFRGKLAQAEEAMHRFFDVATSWKAGYRFEDETYINGVAQLCDADGVPLMAMTVRSRLHSKFTNHLGIFRTYASLETDKGKGTSLNLHGFAARIAMMLNPDCRYMSTPLADAMSAILVAKGVKILSASHESHVFKISLDGEGIESFICDPKDTIGTNITGSDAIPIEALASQ